MDTIKSIRSRLGITQLEFSEAFRIPKRTIESWEEGKRDCPAYILNLIAYRADNDPTLQRKVPKP